MENQDGKRVIRVVGKGQMKVRPNLIRITITLEETCPDYGEALRKSAQDTECLKNILSAFGLRRPGLKTVSFHVDTEYESYQEDGIFKQRLAGYKFQHRMKVEFDAENDRLGEILSALANSPVRPKILISYTVKDKEEARNVLLGKAVADAREKASVLAKAAGVELGDIQSMDYTWEEADFEARPMRKAMMAENCLAEASGFGANCYDPNIEPDDIEISDRVAITWEIR